jgi:hypothetical protein
MIDKSRIKVVKRNEASAAQPRKKTKAASSRAVAREMVSTVTEWVTDLKVRKTQETKAAFDLLFSASHRTQES